MLLYEKKVEDIKGVYGTLGQIPGTEDEFLIKSEELRYKKWFNDGNGGIKDAEGKEIIVAVDGEVIIPQGGEKPEPPVPEPIVPIATAEAEAEDDAALFASEVYNKVAADQTLTRENNEYVANHYFVAVAENVPADSKLKIGNSVISAEDTFKLSVGNNSFVQENYFYVKNNILYVAFPIMLFEGVVVDSEEIFPAGGSGKLTVAGTKVVGTGTITEVSEGSYLAKIESRNAYCDFAFTNATPNEIALTKKIKDGTLSYGFVVLDEEVNDVAALGYMPFGYCDTDEEWTALPDTTVTDYTVFIPSMKASAEIVLESKKGEALEE